MVEAKDQGHNAQVFSKKKSFYEISGVLQKLKKRSSSRKSQIFREISDEEKKSHDLGPFLTNQKILLFSAEDKAFSRTSRLRGQGQGLQNVSSRTPLLIIVERITNQKCTTKCPRSCSASPAKNLNPLVVLVKWKEIN